MSTSGTPTRNCVACGETIPVGAAMCGKCNEYQSTWRNELRYWAAIAGFLAVLGSGAVYMVGVLKGGWDHYWPPDPLVLDFDTFNDITIVNPSNQFLLVKHLLVRAAYPGQREFLTPRWDINQTIDPSKSGSPKLPDIANMRFRGFEKAFYGNPPGPYAQDLSDKDKTEIFAYRRHQDYAPAFLKSEGVEHRHLRADIGSRITTFSCTAELGYVFLQSQLERTLSIPCIGVIRQRAK
jgi:predicted nucleic acid-binding Zn ribbon protein